MIIAGAAEPATLSGFLRAIPMVADFCAQQQVVARGRFILYVLCERKDGKKMFQCHGHGSVLLYSTQDQKAVAELHKLIGPNMVQMVSQWLALNVSPFCEHPVIRWILDALQPSRFPRKYLDLLANQVNGIPYWYRVLTPNCGVPLKDGNSN
jgi:hypothetical protein